MTRPCQCDRCPVAGPFVGGQCRLCWLWHNDERYRALWSGLPRPTAVATAPAQSVAPLSPCPHLGPVAESAACRCSAKDIHWCLHPAAEWDRCIRAGVSADPDVRVCLACPLRPG